MYLYLGLGLGLGSGLGCYRVFCLKGINSADKWLACCRSAQLFCRIKIAKPAGNQINLNLSCRKSSLKSFLGHTGCMSVYFVLALLYLR